MFFHKNNNTYILVCFFKYFETRKYKVLIDLWHYILSKGLLSVSFLYAIMPDSFKIRVNHELRNFTVTNIS